VIAAIIRAAGLRGDFWFDEIWSWHIAMHVHSALEVFTSPIARFDDNHPLNTLFMYFVGDCRAWQIYRLLPLVCGIGAVVLAVQCFEWGTTQSVFSAALLGFSYPLIVYSSEARGYAPMLFFALLALYALRRGAESTRWIWPIVFAALQTMAKQTPEPTITVMTEASRNFACERSLRFTRAIYLRVRRSGSTSRCRRRIPRRVADLQHQRASLTRGAG
jgi:hypothetical protein